MAEPDIAIVGAGPVGAAFALLAADAGHRVELFEARPAPSADGRTLALSHASREMLEDAGGWPAAHATPILSIHVSQRGGFGRTVIEAGEQGLPALGYTVPFSQLESTLRAALSRRAITVHEGEACDSIDLAPDAARLRFASGREASTRLLVLADGGANAARIPGIAFTEKDYGQHAVVAPVTTDRPHGGRAYERFTPQGPMALLPVEGRYALVWTAKPEEAERLQGLPAQAFLDELQQRFGDRAGRFVAVGARGAFPLKLRTINSTIARRTAIVGNAAQALHPIAGQGLNLGLRDAAQLAAIVRTTATAELGGDEMLQRHREGRLRDAMRGVAFTDFLVSAFGSARGPMAWGRGLALAGLDLLPPARRWLADRMIHGAGAP